MKTPRAHLLGGESFRDDIRPFQAQTLGDRARVRMRHVEAKAHFAGVKVGEELAIVEPRLGVFVWRRHA